MLKLKSRFPPLADTNNDGYKVKEFQQDIRWDGNNCPRRQKGKENGMDNTRHKEEDWREETPEGQDTEHNITKASRASPASL